MGEIFKAKISATLIHLGISIIAFLGLLYIILVIWYPGVYFEAEGGWDGIKLVAAVDLVLGPSLTFIVYNKLKSKKELTLDLTLIAIVQLGALIWGGIQVYGERPVAVVYWEESFYTVTEDYFEKQNINLQRLEVFDSNHPKYIYAEKPQNNLALASMIKLTKRNIPPYAQFQLLRDYRDHLDEIFAHDIAMGVITEPILNKLNQLEESSGIERVYILPVMAKYKNVVVFMKANGEILGTELL